MVFFFGMKNQKEWFSFRFFAQQKKKNFLFACYFFFFFFIFFFFLKKKGKKKVFGSGAEIFFEKNRPSNERAISPKKTSRSCGLRRFLHSNTRCSRVAFRKDFHVSLRSSSYQEPRHPGFSMYRFFFFSLKEKKKGLTKKT